MDSVPAQSAPLTARHLELLRQETGSEFSQNSSERFQTTWADFQAQPEAPYTLSEPTVWRSLSQKSEPLGFKGRLIGGCLETINFIAATPYGDVPRFVREPRDDGVIVYLESPESDPHGVFRMLWCLRQAGWFDGATGIILGRTPWKAKNENDYQIIDAYRDALASIGIPVIFDVDVGHVPPQMTLINGAVAEVRLDGGKGQVVQRMV